MTLADTDVAERFARDTADHQMTVLHDEGVYRHVKFAKPGSRFYWFELVTSPGQLVFSGDMPSFAFRRTTDMFQFCRTSSHGIEPGYWAEKVVAGRDQTQDYDRDTFVATVREHFNYAVESGSINHDRVAAAEADLVENILDDWSTASEDLARDALDDWEFEGFHFEDTYEWDFKVWSWPFLWACHAIAWGIHQYDTQQRPALIAA